MSDKKSMIALAAAIDRLADDPAARVSMGESARRRYEEEFTASTWVERLRDLYLGLLERW